jgi:hypothetical protein
MGLDSISEQVVFLRSRGFLHNTLVHSQYIHKGLLWAILNRTLRTPVRAKGTLWTIVELFT